MYTARLLFAEGLKVSESSHSYTALMKQLLQWSEEGDLVAAVVYNRHDDIMASLEYGVWYRSGS